MHILANSDFLFHFFPVSAILYLRMYIVLRILDCAVLALMYMLFLFPRYRRSGRESFFMHTLLYAYISVMIYVTLIPVIPNFDAPAVNLYPFRDIIYSYGDYKKQIILNILMFVPMGIFLPWFRDTSFLKTVLLSALFSLIIELTQPWLTVGRVCDITDLITNTTGAVIGALIFKVLKKPLASFRKRSRNLEGRD